MIHTHRSLINIMISYNHNIMCHLHLAALAPVDELYPLLTDQYNVYYINIIL